MKRRIVIAGANGFLGRELSRWFLDQGWEVVGLVRAGAAVVDGCRRAEWDGHVLGDWVGELDGAEVLVNLAGRSVNCRYTPGNRAEILESRTESTRILGDAVALEKRPPELWLNASTATIYRHAEDRPQGEAHGELGEGFSVDVGMAWEKAFFQARVPGRVRKVALRTSLVLAREPGTVFDYLWGLARLASVQTERVKAAGPFLLPFLESKDPVHRGLAALAAGYLQDKIVLKALEHLLRDHAEITLYWDRGFQQILVGELARNALKRY